MQANSGSFAGLYVCACTDILASKSLAASVERASVQTPCALFIPTARLMGLNRNPVPVLHLLTSSGVAVP